MSKDLSNYRDKYLKGELIEKNLPKIHLIYLIIGLKI